jgi:hypothetical protein
MATPEAGAETPRPLQLLWHHHEWSKSWPISCWSDPEMAQMVRPTVSKELHPMGAVPRTPQALSVTGGEDRAQRAEIVANLSF